MRSMTLILLALFVGHPGYAAWPDPIAEDVVPARSAGLTHGPMLGHPKAHSMRVWVRTEKAMEFRIRYATQLPLGPDSAAVTGKTVASADNTGVVELTELQPLTRYFYGVELDGKLADTRIVFTDPWPSFRTLPDASTAADAANNPKGLYNFAFSVSVGGSQDPKRSGGQYSDPPSWGTLYRKFGDELQFHIMNGDYTYEELRDGTAAGIRANYKLYMQRSREMSRLQSHVPWLFMFADHEVNDNLFGAGQIGFKKRGSRHTNRDTQLKIWYEYAGWANDPAAHRGAMLQGKASVKKGSRTLTCKDLDFTTLKPEQISTILLRSSTKTNAPGTGKNAGTYGMVKVIGAHQLEVTPAFVADENVVFTIGTHHYFDRKEGNCHLFFIDTRSERSSFDQNRLDAPENFLIGKTQRDWLVNGIKNSDADFFFIISSVGVVVPHSIFHVRPERGDKSKGDGFPGFVHC
jgi:alkaline phosphatase D